MSHKPDEVGYFGIGIFRPKYEVNVGSLMRAALLYGAAFVFTVETRYGKQPTDTTNTRAYIPLFHFDTVDALIAHVPYGSKLVGAELGLKTRSLPTYTHPQRAVYLFGAEDEGIPEYVLDRCDHVVHIPTVEPWSMNVSNAGAIFMYDRHIKANQRQRILP